ncbi:hypothetical protein [Vagococcus xieshaowenii]|uniref:YwiC-like protein n=1 Tax=Vagococcus xieshaowenii TaxID=2562451 RepID=A0A4Z0DE02_9ENTE|nr:hypothetical protein [Vagococcus xieshaowenii]QCA28973.1 hypothetical protein E4Z98_06445 [Vagococcus xieshaowenii]TFZ43153.1 hypothetical protein E4031_00870 [Vagococcus xieshaowenii]
MNHNYQKPNFIFIAINSFIETITCLLPGLILGHSLKWYSSTILLLALYIWLSNFFINLLRVAFKNRTELTNQLLAIKLALATLLIFLLFFKLGFNFTIIIILYEIYQLLVNLNFKKFLVHPQYTLMMSLFNGIIFNTIILALATNKFELSYLATFIFAYLIAMSSITTRQLYDYNGSWNKSKTILLKLVSFFATIGFLFWQNHLHQVSDWLFYSLSIGLVLILFCLKLITNPKKRELTLHFTSIILLVVYYLFK